MKIFLFCFVAGSLLQSCHTKIETDKINSFLTRCDELNIVYYTTDTFVYKTTDSAEIRHFVDLISKSNERINDSCESTNKLIYKGKGQEIFTALISGAGSINCNDITYVLDSKRYRHRLTYQTGMAMDEIYWHKLDPLKNPWPGVDTTKFHYENMKNNR